MHSRRAVTATTAGITAALTLAVVAWILLSPLAAVAVVLVLGAAVIVRFAFAPASVADYVAASDRARTPEPPWWREFEYEFRRECRRYRRARRRSSRRIPQHP